MLSGTAQGLNLPVVVHTGTPQDIKDGLLHLQVIEGSITEVTLKGDGAEQFGIAVVPEKEVVDFLLDLLADDPLDLVLGDDAAFDQDLADLLFLDPAVLEGVVELLLGDLARAEEHVADFHAFAAAGGQELDAAGAEEDALPAFGVLNDEGAFLLAHRDHLEDLAEPDRRKVALE